MCVSATPVIFEGESELKQEQMYFFKSKNLPNVNNSLFPDSDVVLLHELSESRVELCCCCNRR